MHILIASQYHYSAYAFDETVTDADALAERIQFLWARPKLREEMGQRAYEVAQRQFSLEATGEVYLQKYDEILSRDSSKGDRFVK